MFRDLSKDLGRCGETFGARLREIVSNPGMWAVLGYRFCRWVYMLRAPWLIQKPLNLAAGFVAVFVQLTTNISLPARARIGPGLYIPHIGCIVVNSGAVIGSNCTLAHGVTIGHRRGGHQRMSGSPVIGDRVYIGPGAAIIGPITVGEDSLIGVCAVVTRPVPARGVAAGNPAKLVSHHGSFDLIEYPGMDSDPDRLASLSARDEPLGDDSGYSPAQVAECVVNSRVIPPSA